MRRVVSAELRHRPMRLVAPILAIAIALGYVAGVLIYMRTASVAMARIATPQLAQAQLSLVTNVPAADGEAFTKFVAERPGVEAVTPITRVHGVLKAKGRQELVTSYVTPPPAFRWAKVTVGEYPTMADQIAIPRRLAEQLQVDVGDQITQDDQPLTISGLTDEPYGIGFANVYITLDRATQLPYLNVYGEWAIRTQPGSDPIATRDALTQDLTTWLDAHKGPDFEPSKVEVLTSAEAEQKALAAQSNSSRAMQTLLLASASVAVLVGMIIISNTFTILLAQRRRQIGLLRAIGATGAQVRRGILLEACAIGALGGAAGVLVGAGAAALAAWLTDFLHWGLSVPWAGVGLVVVGGMLITVASAALPARRATKIAPLEALQPVATVERTRRLGLIRIILCALLLAGGAVLSWLSLTASSNALLLGIGAGFLITLGVLGLAPLYIPALLRGLGVLVRPAGPTARLAIANSVRNPGRSAATATALMLAVGLIVTLQVAAASASATMERKLAAKYPIDLTLSTYPSEYDENAQPGADLGLSEADITRFVGIEGIEQSVRLSGSWGQLGPSDMMVTALAWTPGITQVAKLAPEPPAVGEALVPDDQPKFLPDGSTQTLRVGDRSVSVKLRAVEMLGETSTVLLDPATLAELVPHATVQMVWADLADDAPVARTYSALRDLNSEVVTGRVGGAFLMIAQLRTTMDTMLTVVTALLAAAVLVALVGVGNTLSLSVLERTRESALLRAMGLQRSSLRLMLLIEALAMAGAGILVGCLAGVFFGWLGTHAALSEMGMTNTPLVLTTNWLQTGLLLGVVVLAAALASILPGRRAALATPVEALAAD